MTIPSYAQRPRELSSRPVRLTGTAAIVAAALVGLSIPMPLNIPVSAFIVVALFPVVTPALNWYKGTLALCGLVLGAAVAGLTIASLTSDPTSPTLAAAQTLRFLNLACALPVLLWARSNIGVTRMVTAFAVGTLLSLLIGGISPLNPWKFDVGLPVTLLALSLPFVFRKRVPQLIAGCLLIAANLAFDSRSAAGFLLVAVALGLTLPGAGAGAARSRAWVALRYLQVAIVALGIYFLLQGAILEGMLGGELQDRTQSQLTTGGSVLTGGRPEMGATFALIAANPLGYGSGAIPTPAQILVGKEGMARLGYDPNNGYVEKYMFGSSFEVHSTLGDLWLTFGLLGAVVAGFSIALLCMGLGHSMSNGLMSTLAVYLVIRSIWDMAFSPIYTSVLLLPLAIAVVAVPRMHPAAAGRREPGPNVW